MKKVLFIILISLCKTGVYAQTEADYPAAKYLGKGEFVITGKVTNKPAEMRAWKLAVTDYIDNISYEIPIREDGSFEKTFPIANIQDIYLYLEDAVTIFSFPNDTIDISFDARNRIETLVLKGTTEERSRELELCLEVYRNCREDFRSSSRLTSDNSKTAEEKLNILNEYYDKKISLVNQFVEKHGNIPLLNKFQDEAYFEAACIASSIDNMVTIDKILPKLHCDYPRLSIQSIQTYGDGTVDTIQNVIPPYETLDYNMFRTVPVYQRFLKSYLTDKSVKAFSWAKGYPMSESLRHIRTHLSFSEQYNTGKELLNSIPPIRDWYLADRLNFALSYKPIEEVDSLYKDFTSICSDEMYLSVLEPIYQRAIKLAPGKPAPNFELKDAEGKTIRLSDFKGKIVYVDFWGMGCSSCIYEFKNSKDKFHEKYAKEDIVYVYICIDSKGDRWKNGIEKYKLDGINLAANDGWKDAACLSYNVKGIPHYVLIDKEGIIFKNKCDRPSIMLMKAERNELEKLLARYKK